MKMYTLITAQYKKIPKINKQGNIKLVWIEMEKTTEKVNQQCFDNVKNSIPFFRSLGGKETFNHLNKYKWLSISISPNNKMKTLRLFEEI